MSEQPAGPFVFNKRPAVWWPAAIRIPTDGGGLAEHAVQFKLPYLKASAFDEADATSRNLTVAEWGTDADPLVDFVHDWTGIAQETGDGRTEDVPCTPDTKPAVVAHEAARQAIWRALYEIALGQEAAAKNSATPPAPGQQVGGQTDGTAAGKTTAKGSKTS
jgi:hypothetical protein